jgi:thioredoxin-like negative regulator of GroEL
MLTVYCLCAGWCTTCDGFRAELEALQATQPGLRVHWVDIEDEADVVDPIEVETFPTLLIVNGTTPAFLGPVRPQREFVQRLLDRAARPTGAAPEALPPAVHALARRLAARHGQPP